MKEKEITDDTQGKHYEVDIRKVRPLQRAGGNLRADYGDIDELAASIEANGVRVPLQGYRVSDDSGFEWEVIDGHRRLAACQKLVAKGLTIRAKIIVVDSRKVSDEQLIVDMITTNAGKPLNPVEIAEAVRRLQAFGWKNKDIATRFGMNIRIIQNLANLAAAPKRIRDLIINKNISYTLVMDILKDSADYNEALDKIEASFSIAKKVKHESVETDGFEVSDETHAKITKRHVDKATNKVDSFKELQMIFKNQIDKPKDVINSELFSFAKKLIENKLTRSQIDKLIFN